MKRKYHDERNQKGAEAKEKEFELHEYQEVILVLKAQDTKKEKELIQLQHQSDEAQRCYKEVKRQDSRDNEILRTELQNKTEECERTRKEAQNAETRKREIAGKANEQQERHEKQVKSLNAKVQSLEAENEVLSQTVEVYKEEVETTREDLNRKNQKLMEMATVLQAPPPEIPVKLTNTTQVQTEIVPNIQQNYQPKTVQTDSVELFFKAAKECQQKYQQQAVSEQTKLIEPRERIQQPTRQVEQIRNNESSVLVMQELQQIMSEMQKDHAKTTTGNNDKSTSISRVRLKDNQIMSEMKYHGREDEDIDSWEQKCCIYVMSKDDSETYDLFYDHIAMFLAGQARELYDLEWKKTNNQVDGHQMVEILRQRFNVCKVNQYKTEFQNCMQKPDVPITTFLADMEIKCAKARPKRSQEDQHEELIEMVKEKGRLTPENYRELKNYCANTITNGTEITWEGAKMYLTTMDKMFGCRERQLANNTLITSDRPSNKPPTNPFPTPPNSPSSSRRRIQPVVAQRDFKHNDSLALHRRPPIKSICKKPGKSF